MLNVEELNAQGYLACDFSQKLNFWDELTMLKSQNLILGVFKKEKVKKIKVAHKFFFEYIGNTEYDSVYKGRNIKSGQEFYYFKYYKHKVNIVSYKEFSTARKAAIELDKRLIMLGIQPLNIFKKIS
jgi:hypothetical protein